MSRIGKKPIEIPTGVTVTVNGSEVTVKGPKGELTRSFSPDLTIVVEENVLTVTRPSDEKAHRSLHGTTRALISNMVEGVSTGFVKSLELIGVGYRAQKQGTKLILNVGYSHPVEIEPEAGVEVEVPSNTKVWTIGPGATSAFGSSLLSQPSLGVGAHVLEGNLRCVDERDQHVGLPERGVQAEDGKVIRHPDVVRVDGQGEPAAVDVGTAERCRELR